MSSWGNFFGKIFPVHSYSHIFLCYMMDEKFVKKWQENFYKGSVTNNVHVAKITKKS